MGTKPAISIHLQPGRGRVYARFTLDDATLATIRAATAHGDKYLPELTVDVVDEHGQVGGAGAQDTVRPASQANQPAHELIPKNVWELPCSGYASPDWFTCIHKAQFMSTTSCCTWKPWPSAPAKKPSDYQEHSQAMFLTSSFKSRLGGRSHKLFSGKLGYTYSRFSPTHRRAFRRGWRRWKAASAVATAGGMAAIHGLVQAFCLLATILYFAKPVWRPCSCWQYPAALWH